ncbi:MAG TPA: restriction endonuclease subunit S [Nostocaceae cyanobacterium]|nr:restriction endonuclease subunit S [Nostocaceae cyanobacterium]
MSDELIELPEGWEWVNFEELAERIPNALKAGPFGSALKKSFYVDSGYKIYGQEQVINEDPFLGNYYIDEKRYKDLKSCAVKSGDILISLVGTIGKVLILPEGIEPGIINPRLVKLSLDKSLIDNEFIKKYLESPTVHNYFSRLSHGGTMDILNLSILKTLKIPLPPLNEQKRIVAKIEELNNRTRKAKEALEAIPELCDRFRQSVLAAAFRGDLTADWREQNPDIEPASVLLERIRQERRQCWESNLLTQGKNPKKSKYQEPVEIEDENFSLLPDTWCWTTLGNLTWSVKDGPHFSPKYSESGIPFISGGNVRPEGIDFQNVKYISPELHKKLSERCVPEIGDILYTKGGTTGIARVNTYTHQFNVWVHVAVLKCVPSIERFYLQNALNSPHCYEQSQKFTHGVGNQDLGLTRMIKITIPLAPLEEQKIIVERINKYMDFIGNIEKLIYISKEKVDQLNQSILAKAFRGELVPQDPDDEPASILLERIRAEREKLNNSKPKAKRTSSRKTKTSTTQRTIPGLE